MLMNCLTNRWLKECVRLTILIPLTYTIDKIGSLVTDGSLVRFILYLFNQVYKFLIVFFPFKTLDPKFAKSLQILNLTNVPAGNLNDKN